MNRVLEALTLPPESLVNVRVAKKILAEQAGFASGDKRNIQDGIEACTWVAALKPENIAVPAFKDEQREYLEVSVLSLVLRPGAKTPSRIQELVHRAIPYPVLLITQADGGITISAGHKRASLGEKSAVVLESLVKTQTQEAVFLNSLSVAKQLKKNLFLFYQGWVACIQAANITAIGGHYAPALTLKGYAEQQAALEEYERLELEISELSAQAKKEKQIFRLVELNEQIARCKQAQKAAAQNIRALK